MVPCELAEAMLQHQGTRCPRTRLSPLSPLPTLLMPWSQVPWAVVLGGPTSCCLRHSLVWRGFWSSQLLGAGLGGQACRTAAAQGTVPPRMGITWPVWAGGGTLHLPVLTNKGPTVTEKPQSWRSRYKSGNGDSESSQLHARWVFTAGHRSPPMPEKTDIRL